MSNLNDDWNSYFDAFSGVYTAQKSHENDEVAKVEKTVSSVREDEVVKRNEYEEFVSEKLGEPTTVAPLVAQDDNSENATIMGEVKVTVKKSVKPEADAELTNKEKKVISKGKGGRGKGAKKK